VIARLGQHHLLFSTREHNKAVAYSRKVRKQSQPKEADAEVAAPLLRALYATLADASM